MSTTWKYKAIAIEDQEGEATRIDFDALAALPFVTSDEEVQP